MSRPSVNSVICSLVSTSGICGAQLPARKPLTKNIAATAQRPRVAVMIGLLASKGKSCAGRKARNLNRFRTLSSRARHKPLGPNDARGLFVRACSISATTAWRRRRRRRVPASSSRGFAVSAGRRSVRAAGSSVSPAGAGCSRPREARCTSKSRSICEHRPSVTGSIGTRFCEFQCLRSRICSMVDLVVPTRREICASLSSGWLRTSQRMALGRSWRLESGV